MVALKTRWALCAITFAMWLNRIQTYPTPLLLMPYLPTLRHLVATWEVRQAPRFYGNLTRCSFDGRRISFLRANDSMARPMRYARQYHCGYFFAISAKWQSHPSPTSRGRAHPMFRRSSVYLAAAKRRPPQCALFKPWGPVELTPFYKSRPSLPAALPPDMPYWAVGDIPLCLRALTGPGDARLRRDPAPAVRTAACPAQISVVVRTFCAPAAAGRRKPIRDRQTGVANQ